MNKEKFLRLNPDHLDLAKSITNSLYDLCSDDSKEYSIATVLAGVSIGTYMFLKEIANNIEGVKPLDLYQEFDKWIKWVDEVQEEKSVSRCEN